MNDNTITAYPLCWPTGKPRTPSYNRASAPFRVSERDARTHMLEEAARIGGTKIILSTNQELRKDGLPYANRSQPYDCGVALYFTRRGRQVCFCCDKYSSLGDNYRAIGKTIEAMRGIERWGTAEMLDSAFTGFEALPAPTQSRPWWEVLGVTQYSALEDIRSARTSLARRFHPDMNTPEASHEKMAEINAAYEEALRLTQ